MEHVINLAEGTLEAARKLGLLEEEYYKICNILGRNPNFTELSIYSVMWSEHCSYKNSIIYLKKLPKTGPRVLAAAGEENAGIMDIGGGLAVCFKIESHNHPSAIEPYQGAATGVGGIQRDIFTMGARPVATLNSLRFGNPDLPKTRHLLKGVVRGIGDYGNAFGVPTVGGELFFDPCYNTNPLVNAMSVGIVEIGKTATATAKGVGNPVFIVGSATGKDGIHGATFASEEITQASEQKLPSVQVGDPFTEKLLLEATLEVISKGLVIGIQDMGAAGITCSTSEMSAKGNVGMDINLDQVPTRQSNMVAFEILLSESQERMLIVGRKGEEEQLKAVFDKWELSCSKIGEVTDSKRLRYFQNEQLVADVPADTLVLGGGAPVYNREIKFPEYINNQQVIDLTILSEPDNNELKVIATFLIAHPNIASKKWVSGQYDSMVGISNLSAHFPSSAALIGISGTEKALAITTDCNSRYVYANPRIGCKIAVFEAARNIVCSGGEPLGITNCLNFGNPYNPEVYYQFSEAVLGMKEACELLGTPVTGGNVSFYNQSDDGPVFPTPTIGMVGLLDSFELNAKSMAFPKGEKYIFVLGEIVNDIGSSEYAYSYLGLKNTTCPYFNQESEIKLLNCIKKLNAENITLSVNDVSDGGLFICLAESAFYSESGFEINCPDNIRKDAFLFGESSGRIVVTVEENNIENLILTAKNFNVDCFMLGKTGGSNFIVDQTDFGSVDSFKAKYFESLENKIQDLKS